MYTVLDAAAATGGFLGLMKIVVKLIISPIQKMLFMSSIVQHLMFETGNSKVQTRKKLQRKSFKDALKKLKPMQLKMRDLMTILTRQFTCRKIPRTHSVFFSNMAVNTVQERFEILNLIKDSSKSPALARILTSKRHRPYLNIMSSIILDREKTLSALEGQDPPD